MHLGGQPGPIQTSLLNQHASRVFADACPVEFNEWAEPGQSLQVDNLADLCQEAISDHQNQIVDDALSSDQSLFVACAWATNKERRLFRLSPEVLKIDVTEKVNSEKRPLLTVSIRTAFGSYIIVARMLLPDQRQVTFRWAFSVALPRLFGDKWLGLVKSIMTDGDSQEISEIQTAIQKHIHLL